MKIYHLTRTNDPARLDDTVYKGIRGNASKTIKSLPLNRSFGTDYNGYGYENFHYVYLNVPLKTIRQIDAEINRQSQPQKKVTQEQIIDRWARRLSKLTSISEEEAKKIAHEKIDYNDEKVNEIYERECEQPSRQRDALLRRMQRANPLRYIKDTEHAYAILAASDRHNNTNYDNLLDEGRELAEQGEIGKDEVKDYARQKIHGIVI